MTFGAVLVIISSVNCAAQDFKYYRYDTDYLSKEFYQGRREALRSKLPDNSMAVLFSNPERNRSADGDYQYHQDPDFYYLTGFTEPSSILIIFKTTQKLNGETSKEFLFIQERDPEREVWTGRRAGIEGARYVTGIQNVFFDSLFENATLDTTLTSLYILPKGVVDKKGNYDLYNLVELFKKKCNCDGKDLRLRKLMNELREVKQPEEIALMRKSINMSCEGHNEMMRAVKPGMYEYDVQAIGEYVFKSEGSEYVAYSSICGGAENSVILHYNTNRRVLKAGDLQLNDMGAEYHGYCSDVTRTIPVNGKFSPEQKIIYELVLKAADAGIEACKTGNEFLAPHYAAVQVIVKGLIELGIIKDSADYRKYFMHGTSHYLGLDTHDPGTRGKLKPGNVLTVEPGIYIAENSPCDKKWWNIGVRIEDDILITETGYENLSSSSPRTVAEIEKLMQEQPKFVR